jgi:hypothetical protein
MRMTRTAPLRSPVLAFAAALAIMACDRADPPASLGTSAAPAEDAAMGPQAQQDAKGIAFAEGMTGLKARGLDPQATEAAIRDLRIRFGYPLSASEGTGKRAARPMGPEAAEALAKAAAPGSKWKNVKALVAEFPTAIRQSFIISPQGKLHAWTSLSAAEQGVDPVMIAYTQTSVGSAHSIKVLGYVDDISSTNLGSEITWINNTGSNVTVDVLVFVYSPDNAGTIKLSVQPSVIPITYNYATGVTAAPSWNNDVAGGMAGCSGPWQSRIQFLKVAGGGHRHGLLAVNYKGMTGGEIIENTALLALGAWIPGGAYNMMLAYVPWGTGLEADDTKYWAFQDDRYDCFM